jgi:hypothetical protein
LPLRHEESLACAPPSILLGPLPNPARPSRQNRGWAATELTDTRRIALDATAPSARGRARADGPTSFRRPVHQCGWPESAAPRGGGGGWGGGGGGGGGVCGVWGVVVGWWVFGGVGFFWGLY